MAKSNKNQYYLSFDINTKDPNFYSNIYSDIKSFMIKNNFLWRKDSNYLSINRISKTKIYKFQRLFSNEFKENLSCINKIDWNVYDKNLSFSFRKTINKTIYNNLSKQKTKSHSRPEQEQEDEGMEI